jgi:CDP-diacylglycerol--glycerol-3-phosphate 3-phosphatidyltransferase
MSLANIISMIRIALLPIIIYLIYQETVRGSFWAFVLMIIAIASDFLDGYIARIKDEETKVGSFLDPFADKLLVVGLLLVFVIRDAFWAVPFIVFIVRDIIVAILRLLASREDIHLKQWVAHKPFIYAQYGILFGLLLYDFFLYQGLFLGYIEASDVIIFVFSVIAVVLALWSVIYYSTVYIVNLRSRKKSGKKVEKKNLVILANRRSRGYKSKYRRRLLEIFSKRRKAKIIYLPHKVDMFAGIASKVKKDDHIIIAGGDGSFEGALNYKPLKKKSLGFFPLGGGNAFYAHFYKGKRFEYLRSRFSFQEAELDILELEWEKGKIETTFLALGVDAAVIRLSKDRTQYGFWNYFVGTWKALWRVRANYDFDCRVDERKYNLKNSPNITIGKVPYYGFSIRSLVGKIDYDDGKVYGLAVVNSHSLFLNKAIRVWALGLSALGIDKPPLISMKGKKFHVKSEVPFPFQAGGEFLGYTHWIKVKVVRKQKVLII